MSSRLYGLDYIPSPLGKNMWKDGTSTNILYPLKNNLNNGVSAGAYYTNTFVDTKNGISDSNLLDSNYGAYTGLLGRDLSDKGENAKNTARWIISINVGKSGDTTNVLSGFQDKMMAIETRIGENLNTGMSINQSPNPYDGTVKQTSLTTSDYVVINNLGTKNEDGTGTYPCNSSSVDCGTASALASNTTNPAVSDLNKKDLSNLSRTYVWIGNNTGIKESEKYQMVGDIRHNPYIDTLEYDRVNLHFNTIVKDGGPASNTNDVQTASSLRDDVTKTSSADYPNLGTFDANTTLAQNKTLLDISRFFELFKRSLIHTNSIYNSLIGYSFYYYGLGGEVGSNGNANNNATTGPKGSVNFVASGIPYNDDMVGQIGEGTGDRYNEILEAGANPTPKTVGSRIVGSNDRSWGSLPWIGELYPDDFFGGTNFVSWSKTGNLPAAVTGFTVASNGSNHNNSFNKFSKQLYTTGFSNLSSDWSTEKAYSVNNIEPRNRLTDTGAKIFFHGSDDATTKVKSFSQYLTAPPFQTNMATGTITNTGKDLVSNYGLIMPNTIDVARPFNFVGTIPDTPLWKMYDSKFSQLYFLNNTTYDTSTTSGSTAVFYDTGNGGHATKAASAPVIIDASGWETSGRKKGYVLINGLASQGVESGTIIGRYALMSMLHTYFRTGNNGTKALSTAPLTPIDIMANRSIMVERTVLQDSTNATSPALLTPRDGVEIKVSETASSGITIAWQTSWKKWDGTKYTNDYSDTWAEQNIQIKYNVLVSTDNRKTWKYLTSGNNLSTETATPGVYNSTSASYVLSTVNSNFSGTAVSDTAKLKLDGLDGEVIFRVEGHRFDTSNGGDLLIPTNYSYHERTISINRS